MADRGADQASQAFYEAQGPSEAHLQHLLEELPRMQQVQARLEAHHAAGQLLAKYACVDDLEGDIEELEGKDSLRDGINPALFATLLSEKRAALKRERARFEHDLARSRFTSVPEAARARIPEGQAQELEGALNRYREDYAYTLSLCQAK